MGFSVMFPFLPLYVQELGTRTPLSLEFWAGMAYSAQAVTMMVASPIWGALADRYGRKVMVERAMFGGTIILALMGFARSAEELVLLRAIQGLITGTVSAANALVAASVPRERTGYAMGILQVASWTGIAVGPLFGGVLADAFGYRPSFLVTSAALLLGGVIVWLGVEEEFATPAETGGRGSLLGGWNRLLSMPGLSATYAMRFSSYLGQYMLLPIAPLFIQSLVHSTSPVATLTGLVTGVASATGTASAVYMGRLGDRVGHHRVVWIGAGLAALFYFPQSYVTNVWQLLALQALTGAATGGVMPSLSALLARYSPPGDEGATYGLDNSIISASRAAAPLIGAGLAVWLGLRGIFAASAVVYAATAVLGFRLLPRVEAARRAAGAWPSGRDGGRARSPARRPDGAGGEIGP